MHKFDFYLRALEFAGIKGRCACAGIKVLLGHDSCGEEQLVSKLIAESALGKGLTSKVVARVVAGTTKDWHALCFGLVSRGKWGV